MTDMDKLMACCHCVKMSGQFHLCMMILLSDHREFLVKWDHIGGIMVNMLILSAVEGGFVSGQVKARTMKLVFAFQLSIQH